MLILAFPAEPQNVVLTVNGVITVDASVSRSFKVPLSANVTSLGITNGSAGEQISILFYENSPGGFTVTFASTISGTCSLSTTAFTYTQCTFTFDAGNNTWVAASNSLGVSSGTPPSIIKSTIATSCAAVPNQDSIQVGCPNGPQISINGGALGGVGAVSSGTTAPGGSCSAGQLYFNTTTNGSYYCNGGAWAINAQVPFTALNAPTTLSATQNNVLATAGAAGIALTLPTAVGIGGTSYTIKRADSGAGNVLINTTSAQTCDGVLNGSTCFSLVSAGQFVQLTSDGTNWRVANASTQQFDGSRFCTSLSGPDQTCSNNAMSALPSSGGAVDLRNIASLAATGPIIIPTEKPIKLIGNGQGTVLKKNYNGTTGCAQPVGTQGGTVGIDALICAVGSLTATTTTLTQSARFGDQILVVANSAGFVPGRWALLQDLQDTTNNANWEVVQIDSVPDPKHINLKESIVGTALSCGPSVSSIATNGATESGTTATFTTQAAHSLMVNMRVFISGVSVAGYNGDWTVATVPSSTTFTATMSTAGLGTGTGGTVLPYSAHYGSGNCAGSSDAGDTTIAYSASSNSNGCGASGCQAKVTMLNRVILDMENLAIDGSASGGTPNNNYIAEFAYCIDCKMNEIYTEAGQNGIGYEFDMSRHISVNNLTWRNNDPSAVGAGRNGNPVVFSLGAADWVLSNSNFWRFGETTVSLRAHDGLISGNTFSSGGDQGLNVHGTGNHRIRVIGNVIEGVPNGNQSPLTIIQEERVASPCATGWPGSCGRVRVSAAHGLNTGAQININVTGDATFSQTATIYDCATTAGGAFTQCSGASVDIRYATTGSAVVSTLVGGTATPLGGLGSGGIAMYNVGNKPCDGDGDIEFASNTISNVQLPGISAASNRNSGTPTFLDMENVDIHDNHLSNLYQSVNGGVAAVETASIHGLQLHDNLVKDVPTASLSTNYGFLVESQTSLPGLRHAQIHDNTVMQTRQTYNVSTGPFAPGAASTIVCFAFFDIQYSDIHDNIADGCDSATYQVQASTAPNAASGQGALGSLSDVTMSNNRSLNGGSWNFSGTPANITNLRNYNNSGEPTQQFGTNSIQDIRATGNPAGACSSGSTYTRTDAGPANPRWLCINSVWTQATGG